MNHILKATCMMVPVFVSLIGSPAGAAGVDFIVPGVSLESVDFTPGTSVSYLIISRSYDVEDSSFVSLSVLRTDTGSVALRIVSSTYPVQDEESVTVKLTLSRRFKEIETAKGYLSCIEDIQVKEGRSPFREPSPEEIEDFDLERLFLESNRGMEQRRLEPEEIVTAAGTFQCEVYEYFRSDTNAVMMGGVEAERLEEERSILRISRDVPFWGLVGSVIERKSSTVIESVSRFRNPRPTVNRTESVLISCTGCGP